MFIEDPAYLCEVALALVEKQEQSDQRKTKKERQALSLSTIGRVMELVTLRHRLLEAAWETEVLSEVRTSQTSAGSIFNLRFLGLMCLGRLISILLYDGLQ